MAWIDLANDQIPSYTDLSSSGLPLKAGQAHLTSNECPTKAQLNVKYSVSPSLLSGYADNQLVPKSNIGGAGSERFISFISQRTRVFHYTIISNSISQISFIVSEGCGYYTQIRIANPITTSTITVNISIDGDSISETFNYSFRILDNATKSIVYYTTSASVLVGSTAFTTTLTVTGLTSGFDYYYEGIATSTSCPV